MQVFNHLCQEQIIRIVDAEVLEFLTTWVFPETIVGITLASATLSPFTPSTRNSEFTTASESSVALPILQVPTGWYMVRLT